MRFKPLPLEGAFQIELEKREDERGFFARVFCAREFQEQGLATTWVQMNTSFNVKPGTVCGLHFQRPPMAETKMVKCIRGAVFDVLADLRANSPTFGRWTGLELTADNRAMAYIPKGFAHGFQTLTEDCEVLYFHDTQYSAPHEGGVSHVDPDLAVRWPLPVGEVSPRDQSLPPLALVGPITP